MLLRWEMLSCCKHRSVNTDRFEEVEDSGDKCHICCGNQTQIAWKEMTFVGK